MIKSTYAEKWILKNTLKIDIKEKGSSTNFFAIEVHKGRRNFWVF